MGRDVWVIAKSRLREFWLGRKADSKIAERDLSNWYKTADNAEWANFGALKQTFGSADQVGNCVVFDVGNNRFRVIGRVIYEAGKLYILKVMDHQEYDKDRWANDCGCYRPPPDKPAASKTPRQGRAPSRRPRKGR